MADRAAMVLEDRDVHWGCGGALAVGSLLPDGTKVRLTGQNTVRGTFSHRHAVYTDQETRAEYAPLNHLDECQNVFQVGAWRNTRHRLERCLPEGPHHVQAGLVDAALGS